MNSAAILQQYEWLQSNKTENVVMGDDLDAALATVLYLSKNPNATLIGIYVAYERLFFNTNLSKTELANSVFIDLDICHWRCRSLGHHIVRMSNSNQLRGLKNSCNPNEIVGRSIDKQYTKKYPLGTVHFLMWLYDAPIPTELAEALIWLADSSFINGQSHKFRDNVAQWLAEMPTKTLTAGFDKIDTPAFEITIEAVQQHLQTQGFEKGKGQATSRHRELTGFQCQPKAKANEAEIKDYVFRLITTVKNITNWQIDDKQINLGNMQCFNGLRRSGTVEETLKNTNLDDFLTSNNVFSYAFPYRDNINFTVMK